MVVCESGFFSPDATEVCAPCPRGRFQPATRSSKCEPCALGTFCEGVVAACTTAPILACEAAGANATRCAAVEGCVFVAGDTSNADLCTTAVDESCASAAVSDAVCSAVGGGGLCAFVSASGAVAELACPPGSANDDPSEPCKACERGRFQNARGQPACEVCSDGTFCEAGAIAEAPCGKGSFSPAPDVPCMACAVGLFNSDIGQSECRQCSQGTFCGAGATEEMFCPAGSYSERPSVPCRVCSPGFFQTHIGRSDCQECGDGKFCAAGSTRESDCPAGSYCTTPALKTACDRPGQYCPALRSDASQPGICSLRSPFNDNAVAGSYCPNTTAEIPCLPPEVPLGAHCDIGSAAPQRCPAGSACARPEEVKPCPEKHYALCEGQRHRSALAVQIADTTSLVMRGVSG